MSKEKKAYVSFRKKPILDSIPIKISLQDSVGFSSDSLIWAKFPDSGRKPEKLDIQINSGKSFYQDLDIQLTFNKPVNQINLDSLQLKIDSLFIPIQKHMLSFVDSSKRDVLHIKAFLADSLQTELVTLIAPDSTFQDIEGEYNEKKVEANYRKLVRKNLADGISGEVIGTEGPLIIQLINGKKEITYQQVLDTKTKFSFSLLDPGTYTLRVIEDSNGNGIWDPSNYMQRKLAERVFYYKGEDQTQDLIIRGGWTIEDLLISATPATGLHKNKN